MAASRLGPGEGVDVLFQERISEERQVGVEVAGVPGRLAPDGPLGHKGSASKLHPVLNPVEALPDVFLLPAGDTQIPRAHPDFEASRGFGPGRVHFHPNGLAAGGRGGGDLHPSSHGAGKVVLEAPGSLGQPGLVRPHQAPAAAEVRFGPRGSSGGIPQLGPPGQAQFPHEVEGLLAGFLEPASQRFLQDLSELSGPAQFFTAGTAVEQLPAVRLGTQLDIQEIVFLEGELELGPVPVQEPDELMAREQVPVLADHRNVNPPELIGAQKALRGETHGGAQGQHVGFTGLQHPGDPGGVGQLPVAPHELEDPIGEMRLRNGLRRSGGRIAGAAAAEAESQRTQGKKFPALHGVPFRGCRVAVRFSAPAGLFRKSLTPGPGGGNRDAVRVIEWPPMFSTLHPLDLAVLAVYFLVVTFLGVVVGKRKTKNLRDFFTAGGKWGSLVAFIYRGLLWFTLCCAQMVSLVWAGSALMVFLSSQAGG